jgi:aspartate/glutamate racemase
MPHSQIHAYRDGTSWPDEDFSLPLGQHTSGHAIGILLLDDFFWPFMPGDMANAATFEFPVLHHIVRGSTLAQVKQVDATVGAQLVAGARQLEAQGVRAIVGGCGFFGYYQAQVAAAVDVPVVLSSLEQIAWVRRTLKPTQKIAVFSDMKSLTPQLFAACGTDDTSCIVPAHTSGLAETARQRELGCINPHRYSEQLVALAEAHLEEHPDIGAIVAEYTEFPTFAWAVQHAIKVPIFDCTTLTRWIQSGVVRRPFAGII